MNGTKFGGLTDQLFHLAKVWGAQCSKQNPLGVTNVLTKYKSI